jgi:glutamate 5-kinase
MKARERWIVKAGSQMVCSGGALLMRSWMQQLARLREDGVEVIWVTSGAIAWASDRTGFAQRKRTLPEKQALSAIGQPLIMDHYLLACAATELRGSQVLLTAGDVADPERRKNLQNTLQQLLRWNFLPILNENDAVATEEIRFGDNDALAASVAIMMKAQRLILLTDVDGLYSADPKKNPKAKLIHSLPNVSAKTLALAQAPSKSSRGTGGMYSKLLAADRAAQAKIITHLVRGDLPDNLLRIDQAPNEDLGTRIGTVLRRRKGRK